MMIGLLGTLLVAWWKERGWMREGFGWCVVVVVVSSAFMTPTGLLRAMYTFG